MNPCPRPAPIRVYLGGPLRSADRFGLHSPVGYERNVQAAWDVAVSLWPLWFVPVAPHLMTRGMGGVVAESVFMDAMIGELLTCEALLLLPGWKRSTGTQDEIRAAEAAGIPVFRSRTDLLRNRPTILRRRAARKAAATRRTRKTAARAGKAE